MKQHALHLLPQGVPEPRKLPVNTLVNCQNWREAVMVGIKFSYYVNTESQLAERLEMGKGTLGNILNKPSDRRRYFDMDRIPELEMILGNRCVSQFIQLQAEGLLVKQQNLELSTEEKAALYDQIQGGN